MLLNNRPKGISINKNAVNIQANNLQKLQQQQQQLPLGKLQASKTPSPPQLKSVKQRSENDDLGLLFANHQQILKELDQPLKPVQLDAHAQPQPAPPPPSLAPVLETKAIVFDKQEPQLQLLQPQQPQGLKRERPKSLIPRLVSEVSEREAKRAQHEELIKDIDESQEDIFNVCDVAKDIFQYMFHLEEAMAIRKDHLKDQKIIKPIVRQRLIYLCIELHEELRLLPETLYMIISVLDRYFQDVIIKRQEQVKLVAIATFLVASKYEEIYPPEIEELLRVPSEFPYTKRDVLRMEIDILEKLNFDLGKPIPLAFLRRFSRAAETDQKTHSMSKHLMITSLPYYECAHWKPSLLAAAALFASLHLIHPDSTFSSWNKTLAHYTTYSRQQLIEPAATLCKIVKLENEKYEKNVRPRAKNQPKWPEMRSSHNLDRLIKLTKQYQQQQPMQVQAQ